MSCEPRTSCIPEPASWSPNLNPVRRIDGRQIHQYRTRSSPLIRWIAILSRFPSLPTEFRWVEPSAACIRARFTAGDRVGSAVVGSRPSELADAGSQTRLLTQRFAQRSQPQRPTASPTRPLLPPTSESQPHSLEKGSEQHTWIGLSAAVLVQDECMAARTMSS